MGDLRHGDRVVVLRCDSKDVEYHGRYAGATGPIAFVMPDDDDLLDPVEVSIDRVRHEKGRHAR